LRIISGSLRGRSFSAPQGMGTRPTGDRIREALFNILFQRIADADVLDAFAGSGALSFEALSRGAASATLFDTDATALACLRQNTQTLGLAQRCDIRAQDFLQSAAGLAGKKFGLIFLDPPYASGLLDPALELVSRFDLLAKNGMLVAEHSVQMVLHDAVGSLIAKDRRRYGITALTLYQRQEP
jgi:16S rRNA (guanine966-N2)-methyltransferase